MLILGLKGANLDQKGPKMGGARFLLECKHQLSKRRRKISFYAKNQQNSKKHLEDISQYVDFRPKRSKFGLKRAQNGRNQIFHGTFTRLFHK